MKTLEELRKSEYSYQDLVEIWHNLNNWKWDYRLGNKPDKWETMSNFSTDLSKETKVNIIDYYMPFLKKKTNMKDRLKYHRVNHLGMSSLKYEIWWIRNKKYYERGDS